MEELRKSLILKVLITLVSGILMMVVTSFVMILCNFKILSVKWNDRFDFVSDITTTLVYFKKL